MQHDDSRSSLIRTEYEKWISETIRGPVDETTLIYFLHFYSMLRFLCSSVVRSRQIGELYVQSNTSGIFEMNVQAVGDWTACCVEPEDRTALDRTLSPRNKFGPTNTEGGWPGCIAQ